MAVNGDEESLVELKGTGELLGELPHAFQQLIDDGGHLLWVPELVVASVGWSAQRGEQDAHRTRTRKRLFKLLGDRPVRELVSKGDPVFLYKNLNTKPINCISW